MISSLISLLSVLLVLIPGIPITIFALECWAALLPRRSRSLGGGDPLTRPRIALLMPAHNEAAGIQAILTHLTAQLHPADQLIVVADNCQDETAAIARSLGVKVLERFDETCRGKGYALAYGIDYLRENPPEIVITVDADCILQPGAIEKIVYLAQASQRPVQSKYLMALMTTTGTKSAKNAVSILAFLIRNWIRPMGLDRLGYPCLLTGTGMAFPWAVIQNAPLASGNIVEDMQLGLDLAIAGHPPLFCPDAETLGYLPEQSQAAQTQQRTRWEHGHLSTLIKQVPRLLMASIHQGRGDLMAIALDLAVPPLSLLVTLWLLCFLVAGGVALSLGVWLAFIVLAIAGIILIATVLLVWVTFARTQVSGRDLLAVPLYVLWKIPIYFSFLFRPQTQWIRTQRSTPQPDPTED